MDEIRHPFCTVCILTELVDTCSRTSGCQESYTGVLMSQVPAAMETERMIAGFWSVLIMILRVWIVLMK